MKLQKVKGSTSVILQIFIRDSSSTTGAGLTGLTSGSSGLTCYYHRDTDTTATAVSLVTMTVGTFTSSGFKEIDSSNMPGWYQLCLPNAAYASGAASVGAHLKGVTNMAPLPLEIELTGVDLQDATRAGLTALPNAAAEASGGLFTRGTGAGQINQDANGRIDVSLKAILGTTLTETSGQIAAAFKKFFDKSSPTGTINSIPDAVAGATGGLFIAGTNAATSANITGNITGNLSGSVGSVASGGIASTSFATGAITAAAIAADAIGASELAADAIAEIQSGLSTLDASGVRTAVGLASANLDTQLSTIAGYIDTEVAAIKAKTDLIPAAPAAVSDIPTATENADALLNRDMSAVTVTNSRSPINALRFLRNKWSISSTTLTVTKEDDTTSAWTSTLTTSASADPVTGSDPS